MNRCLHVAALLTAVVTTAGCDRRMDMYDQPRYEAQESSRFFADGKAARDPVPGTVARGWLRQDAHLYQGRTDDSTLAVSFPMPVTRAMLERGAERYAIFCTPCHDGVGAGRGMVVRRGFKQPPSFHIDRLRAAAHGYLFDVITNGFGTMSSYASQVPPEDRWAIVAYIRALQLSQHVQLADLPPAERANVEAAIRAAGATHDAHGETPQAGESHR